MTAEHENRPPFFTEPEIQLLQGLVAGLGKERRAKALQISVEELVRRERQLAGKMGKEDRQDGLREAIVQGVMQGALDTSGLPANPRTPFSPNQAQVLALMVRGYTTSQTCEVLGIKPPTVLSHRSNAVKKIGLATQYQMLAWAARDMKNRGLS